VRIGKRIIQCSKDDRSKMLDSSQWQRDECVELYFYASLHTFFEILFHVAL